MDFTERSVNACNQKIIVDIPNRVVPNFYIKLSFVA